MLAVERLRKVNALVGFTRIDDMDRVGDLPAAPGAADPRPRPAWTVATEDRGEGIFLQLDEERVAAWEERVLASELWEAHREAHRRNFQPTVLRDRRGGRPGHAAQAATLLARSTRSRTC